MLRDVLRVFKIKIFEQKTNVNPNVSSKMIGKTISANFAYLEDKVDID